jgi:hypothetical protein
LPVLTFFLFLISAFAVEKKIFSYVFAVEKKIFSYKVADLVLSFNFCSSLGILSLLLSFLFYFYKWQSTSDATDFLKGCIKC